MCSLRCAGLSSARDSADIEVTVGFLMQIDKLVQLIESPVFIRKSAEHLLDFSCRQVSAVVRSFVLPTSDLRLQLLEPAKHPFLLKSLYGVLMLLPQSSAFTSLKTRYVLSHYSS